MITICPVLFPETGIYCAKEKSGKNTLFYSLCEHSKRALIVPSEIRFPEGGSLIDVESLISILPIRFSQPAHNNCARTCVD